MTTLEHKTNDEPRAVERAGRTWLCFP